MAISGSFKQQCPSCEAMVPIKDSSVVGKKVDCPKCKYRFVVVDPVLKDKKAVEAAGKNKDSAVKSKGAAKPTEVEEDLVEVEEEGEDEAEAAPPSGKAGKRKGGNESKGKKSKKKKQAAAAGNRKLLIGVGLAGVGVVVLGIAAFMLIGGGGGTPKIAGSGGGKGGSPVSDDPGVGKGKGGKAPKVTENKEDQPPVAAGGPAGADNTNFLPPTSDVVYHSWFKDFLASPFGNASFDAPGAFTDAEFQNKLGIPIMSVDDILTAENFSENWTFHVIHTTKPIDDMRPLMRALGFEVNTPWPGNKTSHKCYAVSPRSAAWLLTLAKLPLFVPAHMLNSQPVTAKQQQFLLHVRDAQTLIFAHEMPMLQYLKVDGKFEFDAANVQAAKNPPPATAGAPPFNDAYMTIKPPLRTMLLQVESRNAGEKVLFSTATRLRTAILKRKAGDDNKTHYGIRPFWDVVNLLDEKGDRIDNVGSALVMRDGSTFALNNILSCNTAKEAEGLQRDLADNVAPNMVQFFAAVLGHKVDIVDVPPDAKAPTAKDDAKSSRIKVSTDSSNAKFVLELLLPGAVLDKLKGATQLMAVGLKGAADIASGADNIFVLADAGKNLGQKDLLAKFDLQPGTFPPGAFKRPGSTLRTARACQPRQLDGRTAAVPRPGCTLQ